MQKRGPKTLYSQKLAEVICHRVATGESLDKICNSDGMPPVGTLRNWLNSNKDVYKQDFYEKYEAAKRKRAVAVAEGRLSARRPNIAYSDELKVKICEAIAEGTPLLTLCEDPEIPAYSTVRSWLQPFSKAFRPDFLKAYQQACDIKAEWYFDRIEQLVIDVGTDKDELAQAKFKLEAYQIAASRNAPSRFSYKKGSDFAETPQDSEDENDLQVEMQQIFMNEELSKAYVSIANHQLDRELNEES